MNHSLKTTAKGYQVVTVLVLLLIVALKAEEPRLYPLDQRLEAFTALMLIVYSCCLVLRSNIGIEKKNTLL